MPALGRASLLGMLFAYGALTLGVCVLARGSLRGRRRPRGAGTAAEETALWAFFGPVAPGMSLGTWSIAQVDRPRGGAVVFTLRAADQPDLELAVTRLVADAPRPLARTAHLALFLARPVPADSPTPPAALTAAAALAEALMARETAGLPPSARSPRELSEHVSSASLPPTHRNLRQVGPRDTSHEARSPPRARAARRPRRRPPRARVARRRRARRDRRGDHALPAAPPRRARRRWRAPAAAARPARPPRLGLDRAVAPARLRRRRPQLARLYQRPPERPRHLRRPRNGPRARGRHRRCPPQLGRPRPRADRPRVRAGPPPRPRPRARRRRRPRLRLVPGPLLLRPHRLRLRTRQPRRHARRPRARHAPLTIARSLALGLVLAAAILCRATIAATLLPALLLLLVHPERRAGLRRPALALGLGAAIPLLFALAVQVALPLHAGTAPAAKLPLADLAHRTATAPATLAAQLAWVTDPDTILLPLVADLSRSPLPGLVFGTAVLALTLARWWRARAGDGECLFVAAALGNALFGAWLYGDPQQFQLGMALEPLFVLAVAHQLQSLRSPRLAALAACALLTARAWQCGALLSAEQAVTNPMLSGDAQRQLTAALAARHPGEGDIVTTTYNHVGMLEAWAPHSPHSPIHAYRALRRGDDAATISAWREILHTYPARFVVLSTGPNLFDGPFTDNAASERALVSALPAVGRKIVARHDFPCESGRPCLALLELSP
ncbi:hypothetical protein [Nannocystis pusilla]|uniref:hypothetical protein n=1 Tax=Nannocystis pusilla TaxID=889268 RepID=UPI003B763090